MIQTPTTSKIHVTNPTIPNTRTIERKPPKPERRLESGLLELFPLPPPFPLLEELTSTPTLLLEVWLPPLSVTSTFTLKFPAAEGVHE